MKKKQGQENINDPVMDGTIPHQIQSPSFKNSNITTESPFINKYGVIIGDSQYDSDDSPLNNWDENTDPSIMAGDEWVHPTNDIGWNTPENRELAEKDIPSKGVPFMHSTKDVSYRKD